jgi:hypothetical protein
MPEADRDDPTDPRGPEPVAAAVAVSPENAPLIAIIAELTALVAQKDAQLAELLGPEWLALKACDRGGYTTEALRVWCRDGVVVSRREGSRIFVSTRSLAAHLARLGLTKAIRSR